MCAIPLRSDFYIFFSLCEAFVVFLAKEKSLRCSDRCFNSAHPNKRPCEHRQHEIIDATSLSSTLYCRVQISCLTQTGRDTCAHAVPPAGLWNATLSLTLGLTGMQKLWNSCSASVWHTHTYINALHTRAAQSISWCTAHCTADLHHCKHRHRLFVGGVP